MRLFTLCLSASLLAPIASESVNGKEGTSPWIATTGIIRDGGQSGSGVYLKSGLIITAAYLTAFDANMSARIAGVVLPAKVFFLQHGDKLIFSREPGRGVRPICGASKNRDVSERARVDTSTA